MSRGTKVAAGDGLLVAAVSAAVLVYEVALTRLLVVLVHAPLVFVVLSLAILGLGAGGIATHLLSRGAAGERHGYVPACLAGFGLSLPAALAFLVGVELSLERSLLLFLAALPPFLLAGMALSALYRRHAADAGVVYAADLAGAVLGTLGSIPLLTLLGGPIATTLTAGVIALAAAALEAARRRIPALAAGAALAATGLGALAASGALRVDHARVGGDTHLGRTLRRGGGTVLRTRWDAGSRVDLVARAAEPGRRELYINGGSQANLWPWRGALADAAPLGTKLEALPFQIGPAGRVLDLGAGGGYDALVALACGAERVVCVEMNRTVVELALEAEGTSGALFRDPRVELRVEEARSFLARDGSRYDVIFSALTSTLACADVRESTFLESTVYTVEALGTLLDRLAPGGRLALVINREDLVDRLALTLLAAWERRGIAPAEAMRRVLVLRDPRPAAGTWTELLVAAREPLPAVATDLARLRGFEVRWAPGGTGSSEPLARVAAGELTPAGMAALSRSRIDPATDDRPHFFRSERGPDRRLTTLLLELAPVLAVALALLLRAGRGARSGAGASLAWFAITGAGFLMIEVTLLSLFGRVLGLPALTLAVVLAGLLTWSGLGSLAAGALRSVEPARLGGWAGLAVAALGLGFAAGLPPLLDRMLALPLPARAAASFACLAPIGFALGIPFPMGLRAAGRARPGLVPWLWGWNGLLSVAGSVLGVMLALELGLRLTLAVSAALYALLPLLTRRLAGSHASGAGVAEYGGRGE